MITDNKYRLIMMNPGTTRSMLRASIVGYFLLLLLMIVSTASQADALFDFQMKLAKKGNAEAQFKVGEMYESGTGVKQDMAEATNWITKAASQNHETANFKLLYWDVEKNGVTDNNKAKLEELKAKAKSGNGQAQYYVGKMHANGVGLKKNTDKAISWLNKAALVGVLQAEPEIVKLREDKQRQALAKRRAEEKKRAQLKAKQEKERQAKLEEQRKLQAKKQAEAKARAEEKAKKDKAAAEARAKANQAEAEKQRMLAQKEAEERQREAQKRALIKKREAEEKARKAQFESDPCSGKSARFLSTCK
jgi:TPR repeat protein